jgi:probable rRNA maturation factor
MITVLFRTDSHYTVNRDLVREAIADVLKEKKVKGLVEISISITGDRMMRKLNKQYRNLDKTTNVLSFPLNDSDKTTPFADPPDQVMRLGDIVVSYPAAVSEAAEDNMLVDDKVNELVVHGMLHLLGIHHEE